MRFGPAPVQKAEGALLAHAIKRPGLALKKGERLSPDHIVALLAAGIDEIIVASPAPVCVLTLPLPGAAT
jgi:molybdenum cofactor cytidylyltransferase